MARKKIREHDSKRLLAQHIKRLVNIKLGLRSAQVTENTIFTKLVKEYPWLETDKLVVKPDMLFGQRGKNNLVLLNATLDEAEAFCKERMNAEVTVGHGISGKVTTFIIEPFVPHEGEYYMSLAANREDTLIRFSSAGGIEIEENWDKVKELSLPVGTKVTDELLRSAFESEFPPDSSQATIDFIKGVVAVFDDLDFTFMEMNPFCFDSEGKPFPLDMRGEVDDTAHFKNTTKWGELEFPLPFGRTLFPEEQFVNDLDEKTGASLKLTILNENGHIWNLVAGGGASVIFADTVSDLGCGAELGNYGEYSGAPNEEETYRYAKTLLDIATRNPDGKPRALLIGGAIANFTDVALTFKGIVHAMKEYKDKIKDSNMRVYVRRAGPNYQKGLKMMKDVSEETGIPIQVFGPETNMTKIVPMAIEWIRSG